MITSGVIAPTMITYDTHPSFNDLATAPEVLYCQHQPNGAYDCQNTVESKGEVCEDCRKYAEEQEPMTESEMLDEMFRQGVREPFLVPRKRKTSDLFKEVAHIAYDPYLGRERVDEMLGDIVKAVGVNEAKNPAA